MQISGQPEGDRLTALQHSPTEKGKITFSYAALSKQKRSDRSCIKCKEGGISQK